MKIGVARIRFIQRAKDLGFTLHEIDELLRLRVPPDSSCRQVRRHAEQKVADVEARILTLTRMRTALESLIQQCAAGGPRGDCPILDAMEGEEPPSA